MAKKKSNFNLLNIVDSSQLEAELDVLRGPNSHIAPTQKEVEIVKSGEGDVVMLPVKDLKEYHNHTYQVIDNEDMAVLVDSIRDYGIILPLIVRELNGGKYEIISGHRRRFAAAKLGIEEVPCKIMDLDDDMADIVMADTNIARETILPSEKARTYKVRLEAAIRQGKRTEAELKAIAEESPDSLSTIRRFIKLNDLDPTLLKMVDEGNIPVTVGVLLSDFSSKHQQAISEAVTETETFPSIKLAESLKKAAARGLTKETAAEILGGKKNVRPAKKKSAGSVSEKMFLEAVPEDIRILPPEERAEYYKAAILAYQKA